MKDQDTGIGSCPFLVLGAPGTRTAYWLTSSCHIGLVLHSSLLSVLNTSPCDGEDVNVFLYDQDSVKTYLVRHPLTTGSYTIMGV